MLQNFSSKKQALSSITFRNSNNLGVIWKSDTDSFCEVNSHVYAFTTHVSVKVTVAQLCPVLCNPMSCSLSVSSVHGILKARILEWVAIPFSRGIFLTQGSNPGLPHCRQMLYHLSHRGSPYKCYCRINSGRGNVWVKRLIKEFVTRPLLPKSSYTNCG